MLKREYNDVADLGVLALPTVDEKPIFCVVKRKSVVTYPFRRAYSLILCHVSNKIYLRCAVLSNDFIIVKSVDSYNLHESWVFIIQLSRKKLYKLKLKLYFLQIWTKKGFSFLHSSLFCFQWVCGNLVGEDVAHSIVSHKLCSL